MPNRNSPVTKLQRIRGRNPGPRLAVRIRARFRRKSLDHQLARGVGPNSSAELSFRAGQLTSPDSRRRLANAVVTAVGEARAPYLGPFRKTLRRRDATVREVADDLLALAARLRDGQPIEVRGATMTAQLLHDRSSPLRRGSGSEVQHALRAALVALDGSDEATRELASAI